MFGNILANLTFEKCNLCNTLNCIKECLEHMEEEWTLVRAISHSSSDSWAPKPFSHCSRVCRQIDFYLQRLLLNGVFTTSEAAIYYSQYLSTPNSQITSLYISQNKHEQATAHINLEITETRSSLSSLHGSLLQSRR